MLSYALGVYRGDTFRRQFMLWADSARTLPVDLTDVAVKAEIRAGTGAVPVTVIDLAVTLPNTIDLELSAAVTAATPASGTWDLQLTYASGDVQTIIRGPVSTQGDITDSVAAMGAGAMRWPRL